MSQTLNTLKRPRSRVRTVVVSVLLSVLWLVVLHVVLGIRDRVHYLEGFKHTNKGDTLGSVLKGVGRPSRVEPHTDLAGYDAGDRSACGQSCWLRLWYDVPFTLGAAPLSVDFDATQHVIDKYQWSSP